MSAIRELRCGCRLCGCMCTDHAPDGVEQVCAVHVDRAVFRFMLIRSQHTKPLEAY